MSEQFLKSLGRKAASLTTIFLMVLAPYSPLLAINIAKAAPPQTDPPTVTDPTSPVTVSTDSYTIMGEVNDSSEYDIAIYSDANNDGIVNGSDAIVATGTKSQSTNDYSVNVTPLSLGANNFLVTATKHDGSFPESNPTDVPTITYVADTTAPVVASSSINAAGTQLTINWIEADSAPVTGTTGLSLSNLTHSAVTLSNVVTTGTTTTADISRAINSDESPLLNYAPGNFADSATIPNPVAAFSNKSITNNSTVSYVTPDTTAPVVNNVSIDSTGTALTINWTENGTPPVVGTTGLTLTGLTHGSATLSSVSTTGTTTTATISRVIYSDETPTLAYSGGNFADSVTPTPNYVADFGSQTITNNSTVSYTAPDTSRPVLSNVSITPQINGNIGRTVTVTFDLTDATGVDLTKTKVLFSDGPNDSHRAKESAKYTPVLVSGNTYHVVINTEDFLDQNYTGNYNLNFNLYDVLGNHGSNKPVAYRGVLIDNSGPGSSLVSPVSGTHLSGTQQIIVKLTDDTGIQSAYIKLGSHQYNLTQLSGDQWSTNVDTTALADGTYQLDIRPTDSFGTARYHSNVASFVVDNAAPTGLANHTPFNGAVVTTANQSQITWYTASDSSNPITYYYESSHSSAVNGDGSFTNPVYGPVSTGNNTFINTPNTPAGIYYWHVKAVDGLGNESAWTSPWKLTIDNAAPVSKITAPTDGDILNNFVTISGTVTDNNPDHYYLVVKNSLGHVVAGPGTVYQDNVSDFIWNTNLVPTGVYTIDLEARDAAGNKDANSTDTITVYVDHTPPTVELTSLGGLVSGVNHILGVVSDNLDLDHYNLSLYPGSVDLSDGQTHSSDRINNDVSWGTGTVSVSGLTANIDRILDTNLLSDGDYQIRLAAKDYAGNEDTSSVDGNPSSVQVIKFTVDNTAPVVTVNSYTGTNTLPTLTGTVNDPNASVVLSIDGGSIVSATNNGDGTWSYTVTNPLSVGDHTITVNAYDTAGNLSAQASTTATVNAVTTPIITPPTNPNTTPTGPTTFNLTSTPATTTTTSTGTTGNTSVNPNDSNTGNGSVLGTTTDNSSNKNEDSNGKVKGAEDNSNNDFTSLLKSWWWLILLLILLALAYWYFLAWKRRRDEEEDK